MTWNHDITAAPRGKTEQDGYPRDGWVRHDGQGMPVHPETIVRCLNAEGWNVYGDKPASYFRFWKHWRDSIHNISAYKVVKEAFADAPILEDVGSGA